MKLSLTPSINVLKVVVLSAAAIGCHADIAQIRDETIGVTVRKLIKDCGDVRKKAKKETGDANSEVRTVTVGKDTLVESCQCDVASCDYKKNLTGQTNCASVPTDGSTEEALCTFYETTSGSFQSFYQGEKAGVLTQVELLHNPRPNKVTGLAPEVRIEVSARIKGRETMRAGTCEFLSHYSDPRIDPKPRIDPTSNMTDCLSIETPVVNALQQFIPGFKLQD